MNDAFAENTPTGKTGGHLLFRNGLGLKLFTLRPSIFLGLLIFGLALIPRATIAADPALDSTVSEVGGKVNTLQTDQAAAIARYKSRLDSVNASSGAIVAAGVRAVRVGQIVTLPITFIPSTFKVAALQTDVLLPTGFSLVSFSTGSAVTSAGKSISQAPISGGLRFLVFGLNQTTLSEGLITNLRLRVDATVIPNFYPITLSVPSASDPSGNSQILSTMSGTVVVKP